jgi:hypothetical protein
VVLGVRQHYKHLAAHVVAVLCRRTRRKWLSLAGQPASGDLSSAGMMVPRVPLLLGLAGDRGRRRVLDLQPAVGAAGAVRRPKALRYNALAAKRTSLAVDDCAVGNEMRVEHNPRMLAARRERKATLANPARTGTTARATPCPAVASSVWRPCLVDGSPKKDAPIFASLNAPASAAKP